jgi:hypothetical protein
MIWVALVLLTIFLARKANDEPRTMEVYMEAPPRSLDLIKYTNLLGRIWLVIIRARQDESRALKPFLWSTSNLDALFFPLLNSARSFKTQWRLLICRLGLELGICWWVGCSLLKHAYGNDLRQFSWMVHSPAHRASFLAIACLFSLPSCGNLFFFPPKKVSKILSLHLNVL